MKKELAIIVGVILFISVFGFAINSCQRVANVAVERQIFEHSYQKHEADKDATATYRAELARLNARLSNPALDAGTRAEIEAQIAAIEVLKQTKQD